MNEVKPIWDRLRSKFTPVASGCWEWTSCITRHGYGQFSYKVIGVKKKVRTKRAHRAVYEALVGKIPDGLQLDHLCRNRRCVNPAHLDPVTGRVNTLRGDTLPAKNAKKTHCAQGHPFSGENLYVNKNRPTARFCRACQKVRLGKRSKINQTK